jgi:hypothetical protein
MKTIINSSIIAIFCITLSCKQATEKSTECIQFIDNTDDLSSKPNVNQIIKMYDIDKDIWQSLHITVSFLSNKDLTPAKSLSLENENRLLASKQLRISKVENFKRALRKALIVDTTSSFEHSIIYRTLARNLNALSKSKASKKHMIIYSDLMENGEISFYNKKTFALLKTDPNSVQSILENDEVIHNLKGVEVWFIFSPRSYEQNMTYMTVANFYKNLLEAKGAKVHIQQNFSL